MVTESLIQVRILSLLQILELITLRPMGSKPSIDYSVWCTAERNSNHLVVEMGCRNMVRIHFNQQNTWVAELADAAVLEAVR